MAAEALDRVVLVTADTEVARYGIESKIDVILRPESLAGPNVPIEPSAWFVLGMLAEKGYHPDLVAILHVTSPLKKACHICEAIDTMLIFKTDSVVSVCEDRMFHYQHKTNGLVPLYQKSIKFDLDVANPWRRTTGGAMGRPPYVVT